MKIESVNIEIRDRKVSLSRKSTRGDLISLLGTPDDIGAFSREMKRGQILKYDDTEFHFDGDKDNSLLWLIYRDCVIAGEEVVELSIHLGWQFHSL